MRLAISVSRLSVSVMLALAVGLVRAEEFAPPVNIGSAKRVTWDDSLMDKADGIRFEMHRPHRTGERCLVGDKPWESWQDRRDVESRRAGIPTGTG